MKRIEDGETKEFTLHEHITLEWLTRKEPRKPACAAADYPIVSKLESNG